MRKILYIIGIVSFIMSFAVLSAQELKLWTTEEQPERLAKQEAAAELFKQKTGVSVQIIPVSEKDLGTRTTAAFAANELPDIIYHPLQYVLPWAEAGILDTDAATEAVEDLGKQTFASGALNMAKFENDYASVPVDGWTQMLVYRKDLFDQKNLAAPTNFKNVAAAVKALHNPDSMYGFVAATKVDEPYMMQMLEHIMLANGYSVVNADGSINKDKRKLRTVLSFYKLLVDSSPPGELYWKQSRELYFAGKAAMIIWSPFIMDELAGLRDSAPPTINDDPTTRDLAKKTGFITSLAGAQNKGGAAWGDVRFFGITINADTDAAIDFVKFSVDEGYEYTLSIAPEGKFPVRNGDKSDANKFVKVWEKLSVGVDRKAPLNEIYPDDVIKNIVAGLNTAQRWGLKENQLAKASRIINAQVVSRVVREYTDGDLTLGNAVNKILEELERIE